MTGASNTNLPDSVTGNIETAQVRDPSILVERYKKYRYAFRISIALLFLTSLAIPLPVTMMSLTAKSTLPFIIMALIAASIVFWQMDKRWYKFMPDSGNSNVKIKAYALKPDEFHIGYDMDTGEPEIINFNQISEHFGLCAGSGSGKTTFNNTLLHQALKKGCPVIYINGKKSDANAKRAVFIAESAGALHRLRMIDPGESYTHHINPVMSSNEVGKIANKILNILPIASQEGGASHYRQQTYRYILQLVEVLLATGKSFTYEDILTFISQTELSVEVLEDELKSKGKYEALDNLAAMYMSIDAKARKDITFRKMREDMSGLEAQLQALITLKSGKFICSNEPSFTVAESIRKNHFIFAQIPTLQDMEQSDMLATILFLEIMEGIGEIYDQKGPGLPKPCLVFLEELPTYAQQSISVLFRLAREANIALLPFLQVPDSLQKRERGLSPEFMEEIMGNVDRQYWGRMKGKAGREWASESFGKTIRHFASVSRGEMAGTSGQRFDPDRYLNPNTDKRETKTVGWSEQMDDMVHASMFNDMKHWESLTYRDGRLRKVMLNHTFVTPPPDYNLDEKVPKLSYHSKYTALDLTGRVGVRLKSRIRDIAKNNGSTKPAEKEDIFG